MARDEQREATEKLNKEFQETLDVLVNIDILLGRLRADYLNSIDTETFHWNRFRMTFGREMLIGTKMWKPKSMNLKN